jgi:hypothetical protein
MVFDGLFGKRGTRAENPAPSPHRSLCPGNPGRISAGRFAVSGPTSRVDSFDVVQLTASVLRAKNLDVTVQDGSVVLRPDGFVLQPRVVEMHPLEDGGISSVTTIDVRHADLVPDGLFEYQHSTGDSVEASLQKGLEGWAALDLPVLHDALRHEPETCTMLEMALPAANGSPERIRRAILGPVFHYAEHPEVYAAACDASGERTHDPAFCNCCFLTKNFDAFQSRLNGEGTAAIRFYAMRNQDGRPQADCRINGEDYEAGMTALRAYVETWPAAGFEFRKQYVLIHTAGASMRS